MNKFGENPFARYGFKSLHRYILTKHLSSRIDRWLRLLKAGVNNAFFIRILIKAFKVDMSEAKHSEPIYYITFTHFFTRQLKDDIRPMRNRIATVCIQLMEGVSQFGNYWR